MAFGSIFTDCKQLPFERVSYKYYYVFVLSIKIVAYLH